MTHHAPSSCGQRAWRLARWAAAPLAAAAALLLTSSPAGAHLIPAGQGTINLVGSAAFLVLSVPTSALHGVDDNGDGVVDTGELALHEGAIRDEIDRRLAVSDGAGPATTVRVDLVLSPQHEAATDRADQIVALKHARLAAPSGGVRVDCDLFGEGPSTLTITATRRTDVGPESEAAVLGPGAAEHAFFAPAAPAAVAPRPAAPAPSPSGGKAPAAAIVALAGGLAATLVGRRRQRASAAVLRAAPGLAAPGAAFRTETSSLAVGNRGSGVAVRRQL